MILNNETMSLAKIGSACLAASTVTTTLPGLLVLIITITGIGFLASVFTEKDRAFDQQRRVFMWTALAVLGILSLIAGVGWFIVFVRQDAGP